MKTRDLFREMLATVAETRRRLVAGPEPGRGLWGYLDHADDVLSVAEGEIADLLARAQFNGYVNTTADMFRAATGEQIPTPKLSEPIDKPLLIGPFDGAGKLRGKIAHLPGQFAALADDAKRLGFTIARATKLETIEKVRDVIADAAETGKTFRQVKPELKEALKHTPLSEPQTKTIFRTYVGRAQAAGALESLSHPLVSDEFPYLMYSATRDSRVRKTHKTLETMGLDGTGVYRSDDPFWDTFYPPWDWNCRCVAIPLSREAAAAEGVTEAIRWVETGVAPAKPEHVDPPPFLPSKGWVPSGHRLTAA